MSESETTMTSGMDAQATEGAGCLPCFSSPRRSEKPCYTNGLTTYKTYLVVAVNENHPGYSAVGIRNMGGYYKLHFWPSIRPFSLKKPPVNLYRRNHAGNSNGPYDGCFMKQDQVIALLNELRENPNLVVAPHNHVLGVLQRGFNPSEHVTA